MFWGQNIFFTQHISVNSPWKVTETQKERSVFHSHHFSGASSSTLFQLWGCNIICLYTICIYIYIHAWMSIFCLPQPCFPKHFSETEAIQAPWLHDPKNTQRNCGQLGRFLNNYAALPISVFCVCATGNLEICGRFLEMKLQTSRYDYWFRVVEKFQILQIPPQEWGE